MSSIGYKHHIIVFGQHEEQMQTHFSDSATVQGRHHQCLKLLRADFAPYFTTQWTLTEHCKESQVVFIVS